MAVIETSTFSLAPGTDEAAFLDADGKAQTEFFYLQPGLQRRTTARDDGGEWLVVTLWGSAEQADAAATQTASHPAAAQLARLIAPGTLTVRRFHTLD